MTSIAIYQHQDDYETPTHGLVLASTARRPDAVSLDYLTAWCLGPKAIGDAVTEGPTGRLWRARIATQGTVLLCRSTAARDQWLEEEETAIATYDAADPVEELTVGFTSVGELVLIAQRPTGAAGAPELWIYSTNPYYA